MVKAIETTRGRGLQNHVVEGEDKVKLARRFIYSFYGRGNNADDHE